MADIVSPQKRSRMMSGIKGKDTKPEIIIRKGLHAAGFRYRVHGCRLPGKPDLVFARYNAVLFVHGCFWHGHDCHLFKWPSTKEQFWHDKITGNRERDHKQADLLQQTGWRVGTIWECALKGRTRLPLAEVIDRLAYWLESRAIRIEIKGQAE